jgi:hypothetical protein
MSGELTGSARGCTLEWLPVMVPTTPVSAGQMQTGQRGVTRLGSCRCSVRLASALIARESKCVWLPVSFY